jgi:prepilin-type N-terminal cleavage/methylation domain-containing protein
MDALRVTLVPPGMPRRSAFTLVEVLIVVVIMAILAATLLPQMGSTTEDASKNAVEYDLHVLRRQIEQYKLHHRGEPPALVAGGLPQLISATDESGTIGAPGPAFPFGPYVYGESLPVNPLTGSSAVTATAVFPPVAFTGGGWLYYESTGQIAADQ